MAGLDAQTLRRALADFIRFNPKQFAVQSSATSLLISILGTGSAPLGQLQLFKVSNDSIGITAGQVAGLPYDGSTILDVTGEASGNIYAQVDVSTGFVFSNLSIYDNGSGAPPALDPAHVNQLLGSYERVGVAMLLKVHPMVDGSQGLTVCFSDPTTANAIPDWKLV